MDKKVPVALLDGSCVWVPEKDAAALAGLAKFPDGDKEFAGAIYQNDKGEFCYSQPVPGTESNFAFRPDTSNGMRLAGLLHTHPGNDAKEAATFSADDVAVADRLGRDSYIRANRTGEVRAYRPGTTPVDAVRKGGSRAERLRTSPGEAVTRREQVAAATALEQAKLTGGT
jgi:hypothetical protein